MPIINSVFRYPGGKGKLTKDIAGSIADFMLRHPDYEYREAFVGSGALSLILLRQPSFRKAWINDKDFGIASIWNSILCDTDKLCEKLLAYTPSPEDFYAFKRFLKRADLSSHDPLEVGFQKLAIHQISFSGLGTMSGGPLGGNEQQSDYKIDCRWNANALVQKVRVIARLFKPLLRGGYCTADDFQTVIEDPGDAIHYLDPPYYEKGSILYQKSFTDADHRRLRDALKAVSKPWILSYDNCKAIRDLYDWAECKVVDLNYTINTARKRSELLIAPKDYSSLLQCDEEPSLF